MYKRIFTVTSSHDLDAGEIQSLIFDHLFDFYGPNFEVVVTEESK